MERWKDIPGYEGRYQASNEGRIRSLDRYECVTDSRGFSYKRKQRGVVLRQCIGSNGYAYVGLRRTAKDNNAHFLPVHHLVMWAFSGTRPKGAQICHRDGDKRNNFIENLRYDSVTENHIDVYRAGKKYGKLTTEAARDVKDRLKGGETIRAIAESYNVTYQAIHYIAKEKHFQWLE